MKKRKKTSDLQRILQYAGDYKKYNTVSWILSAISSLFALAPFCFIWKIICVLIEVAPDYENAKGVTKYGLLALLFAALSAVIYIIALRFSYKVALRISANMRKAMIRHAANLPVNFVHDFGSGKLRKIINDTSTRAENYIGHFMPDEVGAFATSFGLVIVFLVFYWKLGILCLIPTILGIIVLVTMMGKSLVADMNRYQDSLDNMANEAVEYIRGIPVVKIFGQSVFSLRKFRNSIEKYGKFCVIYIIRCRKPMVLFATVINTIFVFLIGAGIWFTRDSVSNEFIQNYIFYIIITPAIIVMMNKFMYQSKEAIFVHNALEKIDSLMNLVPLTQSEKTEPVSDYSISFENVTFRYDDRKDALKNISLNIPSGKITALVGSSGGGKTTIGSLISRFYDPQEGRICIGGTDIKNIRKSDLNKMVSFVLQDSHLIKGSILDNIKIGKPDASREEVMKVLENAQCMDIIKKFPDGVDTVLGSKGVYVSGGEQQRLAIARTMLKNSPIIVLDEATAYADPDNESRVQAALQKLSEGKTVIMIAHRLTTVARADRIFVIKEGTVAESGTVKELMKKGGIFCKMWNDYQTSPDWELENKEKEHAGK